MSVLSDYNDLTEKLNALVGAFRFSSEINLKLERIECLLHLLGNPEKSYSIIHVGGTSGKGSTSTYISEILKADGYKVGMFLSPYLQVLNEMCLVGGKMAKTADLVTAYNEIEPFLDIVAEKTGFGKPSYFEVKLAMCLLVFAKQGIDVAVIEVGFGGTLDATNAFDTDVSVLVSVGLDHTEILGDTVEKIAADKAGIIKENGIVVCGFEKETTRQIVREIAAQKNAAASFIHQDFGYSYERGCASIKTPYADVQSALKGKHQAHNAACAVMAYGALQEKFEKPVSLDAIRSGLANAFIAGRSEIVSEKPKVILDGAHNPDKLDAFLGSLFEKHKDPMIVFALKQGRDVNAQSIELFQKYMPKQMIVTSFYAKGPWQSMPPSELLAMFKEHVPELTNITVIDDPMDAVSYAVDHADTDDVIAVTGSLYLIGDARERWYPKEEMLEEIEG